MDETEPFDEMRQSIDRFAFALFFAAAAVIFSLGVGAGYLLFRAPAPAVAAQ